MASRIGALVLLSLAAFALAPGTGQAQEVRRLSLGEPSGIAGTQFTRVTSIRELSDGTLLVADRLEERVMAVGWGTEEGREIGRKGEGPGEYIGIGRLYPLAGDSTLFTDPPLGRWSLMSGTRFVRTFGATEPLTRALGLQLSGTDSLGHLLGTVSQGPEGRFRVTDAADTILLVLADRETGRLDTLATLAGEGEAGFTILPPSGGAPRTLVGGNPLGTPDQALLFPDGWIAVARMDPYRVDWRSPGGVWTRGAPLPFDTIRITRREKCAAWARYMGTQRDCDPDLLGGWPSVMPPFLRSVTTPALFAAPDGSLLILRAPSLDVARNTYDVVDRRGRLVGVLALPEDEIVIGTGRASVYVLQTAEDTGLQTIRRHPWVSR